MNDLNEAPRSSKDSVDDFSNEMGWDAAVLVILGASVALAALAWFLVGQLMN